MATSLDSLSVDEDPVIINSASSHPFDDDDDEESYFRVEQETDDPSVEISAGDAIPVSGGFRSGTMDDFGSDSNGGPMLPPMEEMQPDEGFLRREWRRQNMMFLEEKEKKEKEQREQIILEAEEYKHAFVEKRKLNVETNKVQNREKEKLFLTNNEKFHADANKQYWKAISDLIPHEIVNIEKRRGSKKDQENKKPSISVIQGPKPGKPTDLSRMRNILVKLKHNPPDHMKVVEPKPVKESGLEPGKGKQPVASTSVAVPAA